MAGQTKVSDNQATWRGPASSEDTAGPRRYRAKVFKSGNSVALRLPADLGFEAGTEVDLSVDEQGRCVFERADRPKRKFNIDKVWGCAAGTGLELIKPEDRVFEHRPLLWEDPAWLASVGWDK